MGEQAFFGRAQRGEMDARGAVPAEKRRALLVVEMRELRAVGAFADFHNFFLR